MANIIKERTQDDPLKKYGKPLTVKETSKISDVLAHPDQFNGKRVKVQGPIVDVCEMKGCWIAVGSDKEFESMRIKVEDGVIVFPPEAKGKRAMRVPVTESVRTLESMVRPAP